MLETLYPQICSKCGGTYHSLSEVKEDKSCLLCCFPEKKSTNEVTIVPALLDVSQLGESGEAQEYRPKCWLEYRGQESAKDKVASYIAGCKKFGEVYPHTFISAPSGMGKTLFASILASELEKKIIFTTGGEIKSEQIFIDKLVESNNGVIFIDEANRLPKRVGFFILPLMEQFAIQGKAIKKFTMIMATTHKGDISKDLDALIQRCDNISLEPYKDNELLEIVEQYRKKQYPTIQISEKIMKDMINSCRNTPRNAKNFVRAYAYNSDWDKIKKYNNIIKEGLTNTDISALKYLQRCGGAGQNSIANFLRIKPQTWLYELEPYLIFKELIEVNNKRVITEKGREFINGL
jgi:Holliday junction resolvasome RuvABC ATP-dependent DNA helicase subunit